MGGGIEMLRDLGTCKVEGDVKAKFVGCSLANGMNAIETILKAQWTRCVFSVRPNRIGRDFKLADISPGCHV